MEEVEDADNVTEATHEYCEDDVEINEIVKLLPIVIKEIASDGCTTSGLFVALYLALEKMEIDDEVDVFQLVRAMQVRRPEFFMKLDQYEYIYKCIKEHLEEIDSLYANCCPPTHYGPLCNTTCPQNCNGPCDLESGICILGCMNGWTDVKCDKECSPGLYGKDCSEACSINCLNSPCNHVTGECIGGCQDGWQGFNCSQTCDNGEFGIGCAQKCYCLGAPCNKSDGICPPGGCEAGFRVNHVTKNITMVHLAKNCKNVCEGCISSMCDPIDGLCYNTSGCEPGYLYDKYCNKTCDDGHFGKNCTGKCNCLTGTCDISTGICGDEFQIGSEQTSNVAAIGGSVAAFIIVVLIIVAVFIFYKRRLIASQDTGKRTTSSDTTTYGEENVLVGFFFILKKQNNVLLTQVLLVLNHK
ncbi:unnamed protein product [Mytilus edulis]|uniref:Tyrosine-protein phosphatase domain-containing protein n=1 Tax=Mytilus edulis TaxID=6550 RepID=A0A8S3UBX9_MYTED|nr:unnamed protein product [Mytilus edulis]